MQSTVRCRGPLSSAVATVPYYRKHTACCALPAAASPGSWSAATLPSRAPPRLVACRVQFERATDEIFRRRLRTPHIYEAADFSRGRALGPSPDPAPHPFPHPPPPPATENAPIDFFPSFSWFSLPQNELDEEDAELLVKNGCQLVVEGANMPCTAEVRARASSNKTLLCRAPRLCYSQTWILSGRLHAAAASAALSASLAALTLCNRQS